MEFGEADQSKDQYSDTRDQEEDDQDQDQEQEQEQEEEEEELYPQFNNNNNNQVITRNNYINSTTTNHQRLLPLSFRGSSTSSSSAVTKWPPPLTTTSSSPDQAVPMDYLSLNNTASAAASASGSVGGAGDDESWAMCSGEREHMFDKVVTPSDVGKLNRLVIPKQHAEKYFPLDSSSTEKGLLLNFEDRNGKSWRFRYSYWNSSQSYVMTKGWSRFVKEKKLDAGDIVSFQRGLGDSGRGRLFIDWRRRPHHYHPHHHAAQLFHNHRHHHSLMISSNPSFPIDHHHHHNHHPYHQHHHWGYSLMSPIPQPPPRISHESFQYPNYDHHYRHQNQYLSRDYVNNYGAHQVGVVSANPVSPILIEPVPAMAAPKRLRLFGVNMEYSPNQEDHDQSHHQQVSSSSSSVQYHHRHHHQVRLPNNNPSPIFPIPTRSSNSSSFPDELSHKGKSSANSLSLDLDP